MKYTLALLLVLFSAFPVSAQRQDSRRLVADGVNAFAFDLYAQLSDGDDNLLFSPYSISSAMALAMLGAGGETKNEISAVMHYPEFDNQLHGGVSRLIKSLNARAAKSDELDLHTANALWADGSVEIKQRYTSHLKRFYEMETQRIDYRLNPEKARQTINLWTKEITNGKIPDLLGPGTVTEATRLVLANAIYFRSAWLELFDRESTEESDFHLEDGTSVEIPLMFNKWSYRYFENGTFQAVEIPYRPREFAMIAFLPQPGVPFRTMEDSLAIVDISAIARELEVPRHGVRLYMPRFRIESSLDAAASLKSMGMVEAFSDSANFPGFGGGLSIDRVAHKTYVSVDEDGTEAAGATALTFLGIEVDAEPVVFRADRPFVFLIRDANTGVILFIGRVMNPLS